MIRYKAIGSKKKQFIKTLYDKLIKEASDDNIKADNIKNATSHIAIPKKQDKL